MVTTEHAKHFYNPAEVPVKIYSDKDEWEVTVNPSTCNLPFGTLKLGTTDKLNVKYVIKGEASLQKNILVGSL